MSKKFNSTLQLSIIIFTFVILSNAFSKVTAPEEFIGPLPMWHNLKTEYQAVGDGKADDTKALQNALTALSTDTTSRVLYIPAGTYRITQRLHLENSRNRCIFGEDPANTTIKWDGPVDGTMLQFTGCAYSRVGRITFDGNKKAGKGVWIRWHQGFFPTTWEYADMVFSDFKGIGLKGGDVDSGYQSTASEVTIIRSKFIRDSVGVMVQDWNTVDFWVRQCLFEDNIFGIGCWIGGIHAYNCVFKRSKEADISHQDISFMGIRDNYSFGSKCFIGSPDKHRDALVYGFTLTAQGNVVVNPSSIPMVFNQCGPVMIIDNYIQSPPGIPAVQFGALKDGNLVCIGNKYTVSNPIKLINDKHDRVLIIDDSTVASSVISSIAEPELPGTTPRFAGTVVEAKGFTGKAIQQAIDEVLKKYNGKRPVVFLPLGDYTIDKTITVSAKADVRIVGAVPYITDNGATGTRLFWKGDKNKALFRIEGPSHVQLKDFYIRGSNNVTAIQCVNADQQQGRILLDQLSWNNYSAPNSNFGLKVDGLDYTCIEVRGCGGGGAKGAIQVIGGSRLGAGKSATAHVNSFGGTFTNYDVRNGGRLLVTENWMEAGNEREKYRIINLVDASGTFTYQMGKNQFHTLAAPGGLAIPTHIIKNFAGNVTFLGINFSPSAFVIDENNPQQNVLIMGNNIGSQGSGKISYNTEIAIAKGPGRSSIIYNEGYETDSTDKEGKSGEKYIDKFYYNSRGDTIFIGAHNYPEKGDAPDNDWVRRMLSHTRSQRPIRDFIDLPDSVTDVRMFRIAMDNFGDGIVVQGKK